MVIDDFVKHPGSWLSLERDTGIVVSSRIRLARNIKGTAFPDWAGEEECLRLSAALRKALGQVPALAEALFLDMSRMNPLDKEVLRERHLISQELSLKGPGSGLLVTADERIAIMINEEDHLRLQAISPGLTLLEAWKELDAIDTDLETFVEYAFSPKLGFLTACPSNVGTGLRASVMIHMPGLRLIGEGDAVLKGLARMGLAVRGLFGEGSDGYGNMFQISNQVTLGEAEPAIIERLLAIVNEVATHERNARARLMESRRTYVLDQVGRAFGILTHASLLPSTEAVDLLSSLKLGVELGLVKSLTTTRINEIILLTQPGHMQKTAGKLLESQERDEMRSSIVKDKLRNVSIAG